LFGWGDGRWYWRSTLFRSLNTGAAGDIGHHHHHRQATASSLALYVGINLVGLKSIVRDKIFEANKKDKDMQHE
jgi:hypothetical protein